MNNERIKRTKTMVLKCIILHVMPRVRKNRIVLSFLQTNLCFYQCKGPTLSSQETSKARRFH